MQVTILLNDERDANALARSATVRLGQTLIGLILILNSYLAEWTFARGTAVANVSALLGALLLGRDYLELEPGQAQNYRQKRSK